MTTNQLHRLSVGMLVAFAVAVLGNVSIWREALASTAFVVAICIAGELYDEDDDEDDDRIGD